MPSVRDFLNQLPNPQREKAFANVLDQSTVQTAFMIDKKQSVSVADALQTAFSWHQSNEGGEYWEAFFKNIQQ